MNANYLSDEYHADIAKVDAIRSLTGKGLGSLVGAYDTHSGMWPTPQNAVETVELAVNSSEARARVNRTAAAMTGSSSVTRALIEARRDEVSVMRSRSTRFLGI